MLLFATVVVTGLLLQLGPLRLLGLLPLRLWTPMASQSVSLSVSTRRRHNWPADSWGHKLCLQLRHLFPRDRSATCISVFNQHSQSCAVIAAVRGVQVGKTHGEPVAEGDGRAVNLLGSEGVRSPRTCSRSTMGARGSRMAFKPIHKALGSWVRQ